MNAPAYNFAYLDEQTKRMIRRAILKAIAIPGYQVPFASREMPMPYGWGTGGVQVTAAILGPEDVLKVIDQGSDDTTNAISIRKFFAKTAGVATTTATDKATVIQTRHRIPETALHANQVRGHTLALGVLVDRRVVLGTAERRKRGGRGLEGRCAVHFVGRLLTLVGTRRARQHQPALRIAPAVNLGGGR